MRQGWGSSSQSPAFQPVGLWTPSTLRAAPPAPPPPRSHAASRCRSRRANQHNIHLSIVGWLPGGPAPCPWRLRGTGRAEHSCGGGGIPSPGSTQGTVQKDGPVGLGEGGG